MSENKMCVWLVALWLIGAFLFGGTPDMTDALICKLMSDRPAVCHQGEPEK